MNSLRWISTRTSGVGLRAAGMGVVALLCAVSCSIASGQQLDYTRVRGDAVHVAAPNQPTASPDSAVVLPIEVLGPDGTTATREFNIPNTPNLNKRLKLWMEIHALRYETEASLQLNGGAWIPINSSTVSIQGLGAAFGGIGGGFSTLKMTLNLRVDDVHAGINSIAFRFDKTDGIRSGFRVLKFNVVTSSGDRLIPETNFAEDDPSKWPAPFPSPADIQAGKTLWNTASLTAPGFGTLKAKCGDCHAHDGRDLKYFNYSNLSIRARSIFHGLSAKQGDLIASYIRSIDAPNPGRPWNPPYQPGPGLDSQPVANWAAGAGLDAVLDSDAQMLPYLAPGGSTAGWSPKSYLNAREIPIALQMLDWNSWLPTIHPMDAFGARFTSSGFNLLVPTLRSTLQPGSPAAYQAAVGEFHNWDVAWANFSVPLETNTNWDANNRRAAIYSIGLWQMVKLWELNQEFRLEGMPQVPFGAKADVRGWLSGRPFFASPNNLHIPAGPGLGNGTVLVRDYLSLAWYQMQLILNDGQGQQSGHDPIDYPYGSAFIMSLFVRDAHTPGGVMLQLEWSIKALQETTLTGVGPEAGADGWHAAETCVGSLLLPEWEQLWSDTPSATRTKLVQTYTQYWFDQASKYTPQQYYKGGWANANDDPAKVYIGTFGGQLWYSLPKLRQLGVDAKLTNQIAAWASTVWPRGNWDSGQSASLR
jgi:hypothetical protein